VSQEQLLIQLSPGSGPPLVVTDGAGGAYIGLIKLGRALGANGEPAWVSNFRALITSVADVPNDEGGRVTVNVSRPLSDGSPNVPQMTGYSCWRKVSAGAAAGAARLIDRANVLGSIGRSASPAKFSDFPPGIWESVGYVPAMQLPTYAFGAPTHTDATPPVDESFVVVTHGAANVVSAVGMGHSVDNLPPGTPMNAAGGYSGGSTAILHWTANTEADLWHYSVYRGTSADFVPSVANRIGQPTAASFQDDSFEPGVSYYKISAVDRHENESGFSTVSPSQITSVPPGASPAHAYLAAPAPNPFRSETSFEYGLAREGPVHLVIYDLRGRRIVGLVDGVQSAGVRKATWDGLDEAGRRVPTGIYLLRFGTNGFSERRKLVRTN
jgi:hypothetical protein